MSYKASDDNEGINEQSDKPLVEVEAGLRNINSNYSDSSSDQVNDHVDVTAVAMENPAYQASNGDTAVAKRKFNRSKSTELITYSWKDINVWTRPPRKVSPAGEYVDVENGKSSGRNGILCFKKSSNPSKQLLKNVTGMVKPGELVAIMGASGAGKTTLLNVLNFRNTNSLHVSGQLCVNGCPVGPASLTAISAYIQQDDLFIGTLTVREHLTFQAMVRMDSSIPYKVRMQRVDEVLQELGLTKCENTQIGIAGRVKGISGGEMKRLAFASEVLTDPPLMFCDEPTSGLDSYMAEQVVLTLKELASRGKTIICTIHQPSSQVYALFDRVLLMAEGRVAFLGHTKDAIPFFDTNGYSCPLNYNPSDFFIQTLAVQPGKENECKLVVKKICDNFETSETGIELRKNVDSMKIEKESAEYLKQTERTKKLSPYKISWLAQFRAVLWRSWISYIKDPFVLRIRIVQTIILSLIIGAVYFGQEINQDGIQNINGVLFLILTNMTMQNVFAVIDVFCLELPVFLREHFNGMYRTDVYFLAKSLAELPFYVLFPVVFVSINYFMIGLNSDIESFLKITGIIVLIAIFGCSLGYLISCIASSVTMALAIGPAMIIPFMLFGGFLLNAGTVPVYFIWVQYLSWFYYGNEALAIAQWENIDEIECNKGNETCANSGAVVLKMLDYKPERFTTDILALVGLIIGCRIIAYLALLSKTRRK